MLYRFAKRLFDVLSSLVALIVFSPMWLVIAVGIRISSKGPVFYTTERIGKGGKPFCSINSDRCMCIARMWKVKRAKAGISPTPVGSFPSAGFEEEQTRRIAPADQCFFGQMSVVGPRPVPITSVNRNYIGKYRCILDVKPGLTCLDSLFDYAHGELFVSSNEEYKAKLFRYAMSLQRCTWSSGTPGWISIA